MTAVFSGGGTLLVALLLLRWLAPQLIGLPVDLQVVQVAEEIPPFYDGIFRQEDYESESFIIRDPYLMRARPLATEKSYRGPNDILGFRNRTIPNDPTIITIGDSQTYGTNVPLQENWPSQLRNLLHEEAISIYNMSVGGWGAAEYYGIFQKALFFSPRLIVVAFYSGNDPRDTFSRVYRTDVWPELRADPQFLKRTLPKVTWPTPVSEIWTTRLSDGIEMAFTPKLRHASNQNHPGIEAGYQTMAHSARLMGKLAADHGIGLVFLFIPTKELVYHRRLVQDNVPLDDDYAALVNDEPKRRSEFVQALTAVPGSIYVELLPALQNGALNSPLYPSGDDGHPAPPGHQVIAETVTPFIRQMLDSNHLGPAR